jgi:hypothetical protein
MDQGLVAYETAKMQANAALTTGSWFNGAGLLLALFGIIAWVGSMLKGDREMRQLSFFVPFTLAVATETAATTRGVPSECCGT